MAIKKIKKSSGSGFAYNPDYQKGYDMLNAEALNRRSTGSYIATPEDNTYDPVDIDQTYGYMPTQEQIDNEVSDSGILNSIGNWMSKEWNNTIHSLSAPDAWRLLQKRRWEVTLSNNEKELFDAFDRMDDLDFANNYVDLLAQLDEVNSRLKDPNIRNNPNLARQLMTKAKELNEQYNTAVNYIATEGKKREGIRNLFYDPSRGDAKSISKLGIKQYGKLTDLDYWKQAITGVPEAAKSVITDDYFSLDGYKHLLGNLFGSVGELFDILGDGASGIVNTVGVAVGAVNRDDIYRNAVGKQSVNDTSYKSMINTYTGKRANNNYISLLKKIDALKPEYEQRRLDALKKVQESSRVLAKGTWYFDPNKIDPEYERIQQNLNNSGNLLDFANPANLLYAIPELGTSFSDAATFGGMLATDMAIKKWVVPALTAIATRNPTATRLASAVAAGTATVEDINKLNKIRTTLDYSKKGIALAEGAGSIWATSYMRRHETNSEVMDAYGTRMLNYIMDNNVEISDVLENTKKLAKQVGISTDNMDQYKMLQLALSLNVTGQDERYEQARKQFRKGLNKVYNDNNALAFVDFLEALPYMSYLGQYMKGVGKGFLNNIGRSTYNQFKFSKYGRELQNINRKGIDATANSVAKSFIDSKLEKAVGGNIENLIKQVKRAHKLRYIGRHLKKAAPSFFGEGIEEGQQALLSNRYQRGEYDDYDEDQTMFNIPSIINVNALGFQAVTNYLGIDYNDVDNGTADLRKQMNIGSIVSLLFPKLGVLTNFSKNSNYDNIRNLYQQIKSDNMLKALVTEGYGRAEDNDHVGIFYEALKRGVKADKMAETLKTMKQLKGDLVEDQFIDNDAKLLNITNAVYNNKNLDVLLNKIGVQKGSENHKLFVQNAVRTYGDMQNLTEATKNTGKTLQEYLDNIIKQATSENIEDASLQQIVKSISDDYNKLVASYNEQTQSAVNPQTQIPSLLMMPKDQSIEYKGEISIDPESGVPIYKEDPNKLTYVRPETEQEQRANEAKRLDIPELPSKDDYIKQNLNVIFTQIRKDALKQTIEELKDQVKRQEFLRKQTGTDIYTDGLYATIEKIENQLEELEKQQKKAFKEIKNSIKTQNDFRKEYNKRAKEAKKKGVKDDNGNDLKEMPLLKTPKLDEYLNRHGRLSNEDEVKQLFINHAINNATLDIVTPMAQAYFDGQIDPRAIYDSSRAIKWKELTSEQQNKIINDAIKEAQDKGEEVPTKQRIIAKYNYQNSEKNKNIYTVREQYINALKEYEDKDEMDRTVNEEMHLEELRRKAAEIFIEQDLAKSQQRNYIINKEKLADEPITQDDIDNAEEGDKKAEEKLNTVVQQTSQEEEQKRQLIQQATDTAEGITDDNEDTATILDSTVGIGIHDTTQEHIDKADSLGNGSSKYDKDKQKELQQKAKEAAKKQENNYNTDEDAEHADPNKGKTINIDDSDKTPEQTPDTSKPTQTPEEARENIKEIKPIVLPTSNTQQQIPVQSNEDFKKTHKLNEYTITHSQFDNETIDTALDFLRGIDNSEIARICYEQIYNASKRKVSEKETKKIESVQRKKHNLNKTSKQKAKDISELKKERVSELKSIMQQFLDAREDRPNNTAMALLIPIPSKIMNWLARNLSLSDKQKQLLPQLFNAIKGYMFICIKEGKYNLEEIIENTRNDFKDFFNVLPIDDANKILAEAAYRSRYTDPETGRRLFLSEFIDEEKAAKNTNTKPEIREQLEYFKEWNQQLDKLLQTITDDNINQVLAEAKERINQLSEVVKLAELKFKDIDTKPLHQFINEYVDKITSIQSSYINSILDNNVDVLDLIRSNNDTTNSYNGVNVNTSHTIENGNAITVIYIEPEDSALSKKVGVSLPEGFVAETDDSFNGPIYYAKYNSEKPNELIVNEGVVITMPGTIRQETNTNTKTDDSNSDEDMSPNTNDDITPDDEKQQTDKSDDKKQKSIDKNVHQITPEGIAKQEEADKNNITDSTYYEDIQTEDSILHGEYDIPNEVEQESLPERSPFLDDGVYIENQENSDDIDAQTDNQIDQIKTDIEDQVYWLLLLYDRPINYINYGSDNITSNNHKFSDNKNAVERDMISRTFFYQPESEDSIYLSVNHNKLALKYKVHPGKELSQKLSEDGWIESCDVYYVVSGNDQLKSDDIRNTFTVSMVIDDHKNKSTYITTLRTPGTYEYFGTRTNNWITKNGYKELFAKLSSIGQTDDPEVLRNAKLDAAFKTVNAFLPGTYTNREAAYAAFSKLDINDPRNKKIKDYYDYYVRINSRQKNYPINKIFTNDQIRKQINDLIDVRNKIIDAYCNKDKNGKITLPTTITNKVKPETINVTNGKFNNISKNGQPLFKSVSDPNSGFGISKDAEQLTQQLKKGEIQFGYGSGQFGNTPFAIRNVQEGNDGTFEGIGLAGKIYYIFNKINHITNKVQQIPIMLREQHFNTFKDSTGKINRIHSKDDIVLNIDPNTGIPKLGQSLSAAEVLLYMIINKVDKSQFAGYSPDLVHAFTNMFINTGINTMQNYSDHNTRSTANQNAKLRYYGKKQIYFDPEFKKGPTLFIGNSEGTGRLQYTVKELLTDEDKRKEAVFLISQNMHWNTEISSMNKSIDTQIMLSLKQYFEQHPEAKEFKLYGLDEFTFKKDQLFEQDKDGFLTEKNISLFAWMLANDKFMTNLGTPFLKDPFVFASGVKISEKDKVIDDLKQAQQQGDTETKKQKPISVIDADAAKKAAAEQKQKQKEKQKAKQEIKERSFDERFTDKLIDIVSKKVKSINNFILRTKELREEFLNSRAESYKDNGGLLDIVALAYEEPTIRVGVGTAKEYAAQLIDNINKEVQKYIDYINTTAEYKNNPIKIENIRYNTDLLNCDDSLRNSVCSQFVNGKRIPVLKVHKDGTGVVVFTNTSTFRQKLTGVFSNTKGEGNIDIEAAREWFKNTLGIDESNVLLRHSLGVTAKNQKIYGCMQVAIDSLTGNNDAVFQFDMLAGKGVHFHEGWHYVNLLLHNSKERTKLYKIYAKQHNLPDATTYKEIEEMMAEDFRKYMEMRTTPGIVGSIRRLYDNIISYIKAFKQINEVRNVFKNIELGKYNNTGIDEESYKEFEKYYDKKVNASFNVPGISDREINKLKGIQDYHTFYQVGMAIANRLIRDYGLTTPDKIRTATGDIYKDLIKNLKEEAKDEDDDYKKSILEDVYNNPQLFNKQISAVFSTYGIDIKFKKMKQLQHESEKDAGDKADNVWDINDFEVSKKDNVAFRAKLFLSQIEKGKFEKNLFSGKQELVYETDPIMGFPVFWDYNTSWNKILENLYDCETYDEKDSNGEYKSNSILGTCKRLAKVDAYFEQLYRNLTSDEVKNDLQLQTQIYGTVKSSKNQVAFIQLQDPYKKKSSNLDLDLDFIYDDEFGTTTKKNTLTADRNRDWNICDDNTLRARRNLPRTWSKNIPSLSMVRNGVIDQQFSKRMKQAEEFFSRYVDQTFGKSIKNEQYDTLTSNDNIQETVNILKEKIIKLANLIGIPMDETVLNYYIAMHLKDYNEMSEIKKQYSALQQILAKPATGNLRYFIKLLKNSGGKDVIKTGKTKRVPIDQLFTGYRLDTEITKMAIAYNDIYPNSSEFSVTGPGGKQIYPIGQNNQITDKIRQLNQGVGDMAAKMRKAPYTRASIILEIAEQMRKNDNPVDDKFVIDAFVGMKDTRNNDGSDYFEITPMEDYIAKMNMTFNYMMTLPTMADKKTWYAIKHNSFKDRMVNDLVLSEDIIVNGVDQNGDPMSTVYGKKRFSDKTLNTFRNYFLSELNAVIAYYDRDNINALLKDTNKLIKNYHGKIKKMKDGTKRLDFGGNGGLFRYFYSLKGLTDINGIKFNLNQLIEAEYKHQQLIEDGKIDGVLPVDIAEDGKPLDGFELIRKTLNQIKDKYVQNIDGNKILLDSINDMLIANVDHELNILCDDENIKLCQRGNDGRIYSRAIPYKILDRYAKMMKEQGIYNSITPYAAGTADAQLTYSVIANHVANSMISVIEMEKIFTGDPAFYKYIQSKETTNLEFAIDPNKKDGSTFIVQVSNIQSKYVDKIKRLGSVLSPGLNLRTQFSKEMLKQFPELKKTQYTFVDLHDIEVPSLFLDEIKHRFKVQEYVNRVRNDKFKLPEVKDSKFSKTDYIRKLYSNPDFFNEQFELYKKTNKEDYDNIIKSVEAQAGPYTEINVSDAQVCIRPEMYRSVRIRMGEWSIEPDDTGYSDEIAYQIIMKDGTWMNDPVKQKIVEKFQIKPLKMSYFVNEPRTVTTTDEDGKVTGEYTTNIPILNKMAIFAFFPFACTSSTGRMIYERMNMKDNELDMIGFESAVKAGCVQNVTKCYDGGESDLSKLKDILSIKSDKHITNDDRVIQNTEDGDKMAVQIQKIDYLRLQLNTDAHEAEERAIGTQFFKIGFSNIIDDARYNNRKGSEIKRDIMACVNAMTLKGLDNIRKEFFKGRNNVNQDQIKKLIQRIIKNNGIGATAEEIINNNGVIASLSQRTIFEQSIVAAINRDIIDINTNGGSAVQQSIFGFVGNTFNRDQILSQDQTNTHIHDDFEGYDIILNDGNELNWNRKDGSLEVILSMNFFRSVLPKNLKTYKEKRQWLIDHDFINGTKSESYNVKSSEDETETIPIKSNPKRFGVGYRIPTQGMSSTFAFTVADVLPNQSGDTIIVPREFTAQTGSDFDVDKLYLATKQYDENGNEIQFEFKNDIRGYNQDQLTDSYRKQPMSAIQNRLIDNYQTVISDQLNFADAHASIDVLTSTLKKNILPLVRDNTTGYLQAGFELTPSFQSLRKMEYSTGKSGIGPFALNITNLALTQFVHLSIDYGNNIFNFGDLDQIYGQDGERVSGWLSAMVNAHVDVAKDPYILSLNVNQLTYKYVNFLLRAGKGISTFTFIAQPALKKFTERANAAGGMYGRNVDGKTPDNTILKRSSNTIYYEVLNEYKNKLKLQLEEYKKYFAQEKDENKKNEQQKFILDVERLLNNKEGDKPYKTVFNIDVSAAALKHKESIYSTYFQVICLKALKKIEPYADELSSLVTVSRVDTKKFGNNIAAQLHYINNLNAFRYGEHSHGNKKIQWVILDKNRKNVAAEKQNETGNIDGSRNALNVYFNNTFLDSKLKIATGLVRQLLNRQTITATDVFRNTFLTFMARKGGMSEIHVGDDMVMSNYVYNMMANEKTVNTIANAIECVIRYRAMSNLLNYKNMLFAHNLTQIYGNPLYLKSSQTNDLLRLQKRLFAINYNQVDLTCNDNKQAVMDRLKSIMYGYNAKDENGKEFYMPPLFTRVNNLLNALKENPQQYSDTGLVDDDGTVTNEMLNYLNPRPANEEFPYGRLLLKTPNIKLGIDTKQMLVSAFDQLLSSPNENIKALANDIAFYAYYSSYDTNGTNSFFDLVPPKYRKQYDSSLRLALNMPKGFLESYVGDIGDVCDVISRNYWYDNKIVDSYLNHGNGKKFGTIFGQHELKILRLNKQNIPGIIATSYANADFFTAKYGEDIYLYKRVGTIYATNGEKSTRLRSVYTIIPKAGIHKGRNHMYEFNVNLNEASLYKENKLPSYFMYTQDTIDYINNIISDPKQLTKTQKENGMQLKYESVGPLEISSDDYYYVEVNKSDNNITTFGNVEIITSEEKDTALNKSDIQVDMSKLNAKSSINDIVDQILKDIDIDASVNNPVSISIRGEMPNEFVSNQFKEDVINEQVNTFESRLQESDQNYTEQQIQKMLDDLRKTLNNDSKFVYNMRIQQLISDIMQNISGKGLQVNNISLDGDTQCGVSMAKSLNNNSDIEKVNVFVNKETTKEQASKLAQDIDFGESIGSMMDEIESKYTESTEIKEETQQQTDLLKQQFDDVQTSLKKKDDKNVQKIQKLLNDVDIMPVSTVYDDYIDPSDAISASSLISQLTGTTETTQKEPNKKSNVTDADGNPIDAEDITNSNDFLNALQKPTNKNDKDVANDLGNKLKDECNK